MEIPKWLDRYIMDNGGIRVFNPPPPSPNENEIEAKIVKEYLDALKKVLPKGYELVGKNNVKMAIMSYIELGYKIPIKWIEMYNESAKDW